MVGYVAEHAHYHHGEQSLAATIINLAQNFVGSNNLNLLDPSGQYGTRDQGGKDHAAPRYIFTQPMPLARIIFNHSDDPLLNKQKDDNNVIEPEFYVPIVPMVLINGAEGIGTGWSTTIPCYNPVDIVTNLRRLMNGEEVVPMTPWWRGFKGEIKQNGKNRYDVTGVVRKVNDTTVEILELPIGKWTQTYKTELETMISGDKEKEKEGVIKVRSFSNLWILVSTIFIRTTRNITITLTFILSLLWRPRIWRKLSSKDFWNFSSLLRRSTPAT